MLKICFVGRFAVPKNNMAIIKIAKELQKMTNSFFVDIYGDAEITDIEGQKIKYEFLANIENLPINHLGFKSNIIEILKNYDFLVLPSLWEGWPLVLIEAATSACIPVCADIHTGPREFIADIYDYDIPIEYPYIGNGGVLLPDTKVSFDAKIWAQTLFELSCNEDKVARLKINVQKQAKNYSFANYKKNWSAFLNELLNK